MLDRLEPLVIGECVADIESGSRTGPTGCTLGGSPATRRVRAGPARPSPHPAHPVGHRRPRAAHPGPSDRRRGRGPYRRRHGPTPSAVVTLDGQGHATYAFDVGWTLGPVPLDRAPGHVHTGSIAAVVEPGAATVLAALESLRAAATVSYDPNVRAALMGEHAPAVARVERCVALSGVVKASEEDLRWLHPDEEPERIAGRCARRRTRARPRHPGRGGRVRPVPRRPDHRRGPGGRGRRHRRAPATPSCPGRFTLSPRTDSSARTAGPGCVPWTGTPSPTSCATRRPPPP